MIDVFIPPEQFVQTVAECRFILSSALHGVICADALNIPNKPMVISGLVEGWGYKFRDYYSAFDNMKYCPVNIRENAITDDDVDKFLSEYKDISLQVGKICNGLTDVFEQWKKQQ